MTSEPNVRLAQAIRRADLSNSSLATRVRVVASENGVALKCTHVNVKRWLEGVQPRATTARFIAEALSRKARIRFTLDDIGMGGAVSPEIVESGLDYPDEVGGASNRLLGLTRRELAEDTLALGAAIVPSAWTQPLLTWLLSRPEPLPIKSSARPNVGESDVRAIRTTTQLFMQMDFQFGGGHARAALAQYFERDVCPLLNGRFADPVGRDLFSAASEVAQLLGWTAYDIGRHGLAQRYLIQALRLAQAADDRMMGGRILSNMSHQATYLGNFAQAAQLARAAQEGSKGTASDTVMSLFLAMEARAHAGNGDDAACSRALSEAERVFERRNVEDDPAWISYFDPAELAGEGAHCFRDLRNPRLTQEFITRAVGLCDPMYVRTLAFVRLVHAASFIHQGEPCRAAEVATEAVGLAGSLKSQRYLRYVRDLCEDFNRFTAEREVRDFNQLVAAKYPSLALAS
ncbi:MAG: regulator [Massilia sp.]|nr:regulator [Massilia sp.]